MKEVWQKTTEQICGQTKGPPRHSETWWSNDEVAKSIEEKRRCYNIWHKTITESDRNKMKCKKCCSCTGKDKARAC